MTTPGPKPRGVCAICHKEMSLRKDGLIHAHGPGRHRCSGSWMKPKGTPVVSDLRDLGNTSLAAIAAATKAGNDPVDETVRRIQRTGLLAAASFNSAI